MGYFYYLFSDFWLRLLVIGSPYNSHHRFMVNFTSLGDVENWFNSSSHFGPYPYKCYCLFRPHPIPLVQILDMSGRLVSCFIELRDLIPFMIEIR